MLTAQMFADQSRTQGAAGGYGADDASADVDADDDDAHASRKRW